MPHELAEQAKASGNKLFSSGNYLQAISQYTRAINFDDTNHIYFSNRATCYLKIKRYNEARKDAERCISILPTFLKGYLRLGTALFYLGQYEEAVQHLETTLRIGREDGLTADETTIVKKLLDSCTEYIREIGPVKVNIIEELPIEIIDTIFQYLDPHRYVSILLLTF
jgi:stress-induced-phosphoprotein 1